MRSIVDYGLYCISFALCFYCLSGVDFARFFRKGHSHKAQGLLLLFALALAYLVVQFFLGISNI